MHTLVDNGRGGFGDFFGITKVVMLNGFEIVIQFIDQGDACGNIEPGDLRAGNIIEMLDQCADAVAVGVTSSAE